MLPPRALLSVLSLTLVAACASAGEPETGLSSSAPPDVEAEEALAADAEALGCVLDSERVPEKPAAHIDQGEIAYDRYPPSFGDHRSFWPQTGVHQSPIEDELQAHAYEHGIVGLHYDPDSVETEAVEVLEVATGEHPQWVFVAPYETFDDGNVLAFTAWGQRLDCAADFSQDPEALEELVNGFLELYMDQGPESVPGEPVA